MCESFQNDLISTSLLLKELKEQEEVVPCLNHQAHKIPPDDIFLAASCGWCARTGDRSAFNVDFNSVYERIY